MKESPDECDLVHLLLTLCAEILRESRNYLDRYSVGHRRDMTDFDRSLSIRRRTLLTSAEVRKAIARLFSSSGGHRAAINTFVGESAEAYLTNPFQLPGA